MQDVKGALAAGHPVLLSLNIYMSLWSDTVGNGRGGRSVFLYPDKKVDPVYWRHLVTGYNDEEVCPGEPGPGAVQVEMGGWGDQSHAHLPYRFLEDPDICNRACCIVQQRTDHVCAQALTPRCPKCRCEIRLESETGQCDVCVDPSPWPSDHREGDLLWVLKDRVETRRAIRQALPRMRPAYCALIGLYAGERTARCKGCDWEFFEDQGRRCDMCKAWPLHFECLSFCPECRSSYSCQNCRCDC